MQALMILAAVLLALLEAVSTFVPYRKGKYRRWRRKKRLVPAAKHKPPQPPGKEAPGGKPRA